MRMQPLYSVVTLIPEQQVVSPSYVDVSSSYDSNAENLWHTEKAIDDVCSKRWSQDAGENVYGEKRLRLFHALICVC